MCHTDFNRIQASKLIPPKIICLLKFRCALTAYSNQNTQKAAKYITYKNVAALVNFQNVIDNKYTNQMIRNRCLHFSYSNKLCSHST